MSQGGGIDKVTAFGAGLERGTTNCQADFTISTREAGSGILSIAVKGPSKAEINLDDREDGSCMVTYAVPESGEHRDSDNPYLIQSLVVTTSYLTEIL